MRKATKPCGCWPSVITAEMVAGQSVRLGQLASDQGYLYWSESRPMEKGRGVVVRRTPDGLTSDVIPPPFSARSRVHEYGGGEFLPADGTVYFVNAADQDIYTVVPGEAPERLTDIPGMRFADPVLDRARNRLIAVAEQHRDEHDPMPENLLVTVDLAERRGAVDTLVAGRDFYAAPRLDGDCERLAWLEWSLPAMPWEAAELHCAGFDATGALGTDRRIAGGQGSAAFQPDWARDGTLYYVWNGSGWGNIHRWRNEEIEVVARLDAEFGRPMWVFGMRTYALLDDGRLFATYLENGRFRCATIDPESGEISPLVCEARSFEFVVAMDAGAAAVAAFDDAPPAVAAITPGRDGTAGIERLRPSAEIALDDGDISVGEPVAIPDSEGSIFAIHYAPKSARWRAAAGELPPAVMMVHGGPTSHADRGLRLKVQYWTSRGFAVLDLDFAGSFGYGRDYRKALDGNWGIRDAADAADAARWLATSGLADPRRIVITGGSAGGYTALNALVHHDLFAAAAAYYGVSDVARLVRTTHKFESGYVSTLTGIAADADDAAYRAISPLDNADRINRPVILFQGDEDRVVPPHQSRAIATALARRGVAVFYIEFAGESHGFRQSQNLVAAIRYEHAFYARILGLAATEELPDLDRHVPEQDQ